LEEDTVKAKYFSSKFRILRREKSRQYKENQHIALGKKKGRLRIAFQI